MSLVEHAKRELELSGQTAEDPAYAKSIVAAVAAFASYGGHSGASAAVAIEQLHRLLKFETLSPITSDPEEWEDRSDVSGAPLWQNRRDSRAMSNDGGKTWWYVEPRRPGERCKNGGVWGVLDRCGECSGSGVLHRPDELPDGPAPIGTDTASDPEDSMVQELRRVLNRASAENRSNTPDYILASYLLGCLDAFDAAVNQRADWYGRHDEPGQASEAAA